MLIIRSTKETTENDSITCPDNCIAHSNTVNKTNTKETTYLLDDMMAFLIIKTILSIKKAVAKNKCLYSPTSEKSLPKSLKYPAHITVASIKNDPINDKAFDVLVILNILFTKKLSPKNKAVSTPRTNTFISLE